VGQNPLGFAADEQARQTPAAMGGHKDQVAVVVPGGSQDGLVDHGVYGGAAGAAHPGGEKIGNRLGSTPA